MDKIEEVFKNDVYYPFVLYCERHNYIEMGDLVKCSFSDFSKEEDVTPVLLSRVRAVYAAYRKQHPDLFMKRGPARPAPGGVVSYRELEQKLEGFFKEKPDKLLRLSEISKAMAGVKRADILKVLEEAAWCKAVDSSTFFYAP